MRTDRNIMDELAAYGVARSVAGEMGAKSGQEGTPVIGFKDVGDEYEITASDDPICLDEYNIDFAIYAPDSQDFNLIVRKDNPEALHNLPKNKLRELLTRILDSV